MMKDLCLLQNKKIKKFTLTTYIQTSDGMCINACGNFLTPKLFLLFSGFLSTTLQALANKTHENKKACLIFFLIFTLVYNLAT